MKYLVVVNGTEESPFPKTWGLEITPFNQIGKAEFDFAERQLRECGRRGTTVERINDLLRDFHPEFRDMIVKAYQPGVIVRLEIDIPDAVLEIPMHGAQ